MASKLIDGCIPANTVCPFWDVCSIRMDRCPQPDKVKPHEFSCGAARAFDIMGEKQIQSISRS